MADSRGPLSHIRVLDMGRIMAAPWATQILADMGADVIKVEKPGVGDDTRSWGPPFLKAADGSPTKEAGYYLSVNRGKRSVTIDMATAQGQAIIRKLAEQSDVVVENFKVGALARYGLDEGQLAALVRRRAAEAAAGRIPPQQPDAAAGRQRLPLPRRIQPEPSPVPAGPAPR